METSADRQITRRGCPRGMVLLNVIMLLVLVGVLVATGAALLGPLVVQGKIRDTKTTLTSDVDAIIGWAVANGRIPDSASFDAVAQNPFDAWGNHLLYLFDATLASATGTNLCRLAATKLATASQQNIAFILLSSGDDYQLGSSWSGTPVLQRTTFFYAASALQTVSVNSADLARVVTLDELKSRAGCAATTAGRLRIVNNELPRACTNKSYSATIFGDGGFTPYSSSTSGLPPGLSRSAMIIAGTATTSASYPVSVSLTDSQPLAVERTFSLQVNQSPVCPSMTATPNPILVGGTTSLAWSITAGGPVDGTWSTPLPGGGCSNFTAWPNGSYACTTATIPATRTYTLTLRNANCNDSCPPVTVSTCPLFTWSSSLPDASNCTTYGGWTAVSGGAAPFAWSLASGTLPTGVTFCTGNTTSTCNLGGIPLAAPANYDFYETVSDACGAPQTNPTRFRVKVADGCYAGGMRVRNRSGTTVYYRRNGGLCTPWLSGNNNINDIAVAPADSVSTFSNILCTTSYCATPITYCQQKINPPNADGDCLTQMVGPCSYSDR